MSLADDQWDLISQDGDFSTRKKQWFLEHVEPYLDELEELREKVTIAREALKVAPQCENLSLYCLGAIGLPDNIRETCRKIVDAMKAYRTVGKDMKAKEESDDGE